jgi:predicted hydrolase (HD superfamily)
MLPYHVVSGDPDQRKLVEEAVTGLSLVSAETHQKIVTAWASVWLSSAYQTLQDVPFSPILPGYRLMDHVNDVTRVGLSLARRAKEDWGDDYDIDTLVSILVLHDVDKPLIYSPSSKESIVYTDLARQLPHGVIGAMLLKEIGFSHEVVSSVATHAEDAPFHGETFYDYVLHYADVFAADHVTRLFKTKAFYNRKR